MIHLFVFRKKGSINTFGAVRWFQSYSKITIQDTDGNHGLAMYCVTSQNSAQEVINQAENGNDYEIVVAPL